MGKETRMCSIPTVDTSNPSGLVDRTVDIQESMYCVEIVLYHTSALVIFVVLKLCLYIRHGN